MTLAACNGNEVSGEERTARADAKAGKAVVSAVDCGVCHVIPGIAGAHGIVGPSLARFGHRRFVGGIVPNDPDLLARWIKDAPSIAANTGMPSLPLTDDEARDVAAYLYTLR